MEREFWLQKWAQNDIGFHMSEAHPMLVRHFDSLALAGNSRVFLPLCGMTPDIPWLLQRGVQVVGVELAETAVQQLFTGLGLQAELSRVRGFQRYSAPDIDIFVGDFFDLPGDILGAVDAVYDRAALVALPAPAREAYAGHLTAITGTAAQLLVTLVYDPEMVAGPPFSVDADEVQRLYRPAYRPRQLDSNYSADGLKGRYPVTEFAWLLEPTND